MSRPKPAEARTGHSAKTPTITRSAVPAVLPDPPEGLGDFGVWLWVEVWKQGAGVYASTDSYIIERYCSLQERRRNLPDLVEAEGWLTTGSTGQTVVHPAARMVTDVESRLCALEDRLGLNPEARLRLGITSVEHQSRLDAFLSGGSDA